MTGYFLTLLIASVCGAVCTSLAWGGYERYIKYIASLICVALLISPFRDTDISSALDEINSEISTDTEAYGEGLYALSAEMTEKRAEEYISQIVLSEFGINTVYTDIRIDWEKEEPTIEAICVAFGSADMALKEDAEEYLCNTLGGEVTVIEG